MTKLLNTRLAKPTILIVDDEPTNIEILGSFLSSDYQVKVARDGFSALEIARRAPKPDLILLDIMMPSLNGFEVCRQLQAEKDTRDIPVIFITAAGPESEIEGLSVGAVDHIFKPINYAATKLRIKNHLDITLYRKKIQQSLGFLSTIFDNAPLAIAVLTPNHEWQLLNKVGLDFLGFHSLEDAQSIPQKTLAACFEKATFRRYLEAFRSTLQDKKQTLSIELRNLNGRTTYWLDLILSPLHDESGSVTSVMALAIDNTLNKHTQERLHLLAKVFENALEGILITDRQGKVVEFNSAYSKVTGYSDQEIKQSRFGFPQLQQVQTKESIAYLQEIFENGEPWRGEILTHAENGDELFTLLSINAIKHDNNGPEFLLAVCNDITQLKKQQEQLEKANYYDPLTGLPNRTLLTDRLAQAIALNKYHQELTLICCIDFDNFAAVNDTYDHAIGDQVLMECVKRLDTIARENDTLSRVTGDEFILVLNGIRSLIEATNLLDKVLESINEPIEIAGNHVQVSCSIGVTVTPKDHSDPSTLLRHAYQAMNTAKSIGKNCYSFFDIHANERAIIQNQNLQRIKQALDNEEFTLFFQPKINLIDQTLIGAEALIRWQHPERGLLLPIEFLPLITDTDLEISLGNWIISTAMNVQSQWQKAGRVIELSINISPVHLQSNDFLSYLNSELNKHSDLLPNTIQFEIVETAALEDLGNAIGVIKACHKLGIGFALDDFGTGYSSLTYLCKLPIGTLKIDQSFIRNMLQDDASHAVVVGIISLAKSFSLEVVGEGAESEQHLAHLAKLGCDIAQGYAIAKPMNSDQFWQWCESVYQRE